MRGRVPSVLPDRTFLFTEPPWSAEISRRSPAEGAGTDGPVPQTSSGDSCTNGAGTWLTPIYQSMAIA